MTWVTWGACAGHPAAPNAPNRELSDRGESAPPLPPTPQHQLGAWKAPQASSKGICFYGPSCIIVICPQAGALDNKLPFNKHTPA